MGERERERERERDRETEREGTLCGLNRVVVFYFLLLNGVTYLQFPHLHWCVYDILFVSHFCSGPDFKTLVTPLVKHVRLHLIDPQDIMKVNTLSLSLIKYLVYLCEMHPPVVYFACNDTGHRRGLVNRLSTRPDIPGSITDPSVWSS